MITILQERSSQRVPNTLRPKKHSTKSINQLVEENRNDDLDEFDRALFG